ncbi:hypothetical protein A2U01_0015821 [Trifolium medium]|uniref:Uncharacterized protein n=1 Tax=Trifolium medium TaxID=97028 RepID=A0A392N8T6_9FABA|nr:hypothetical protein [Trifolium medium]
MGFASDMLTVAILVDSIYVSFDFGSLMWLGFLDSSSLFALCLFPSLGSTWFRLGWKWPFTCCLQRVVGYAYVTVLEAGFIVVPEEMCSLISD